MHLCLRKSTLPALAAVALLGLGGPALGGSGKETATELVPTIRLDEGALLAACDGSPAGPDAPAFPGDVRCVEVVLRLLHVSGQHRVRFFYYDPQGNLYAATPADWAVKPGAPGGYHRHAWVRHRLAVAGQRASTLRGDWKLSVWLDEQVVSERFFRIEGHGSAEDPAVAEAKKLYLELRFEEAEQRLAVLSESAGSPAVRAESCWWLAVARSALGRERASVEAPLQRLLELDPAYALGAVAVEEAGAERVAALLDELRSRQFPGLYSRSTPLPELELSAAETPPVLEKRRRWYQKWWFYAGLAAAAVPATVLLVSSASESVPGLPTVALSAADSPRDPSNGRLCAGEIELQLQIDGARPPFEVIFTAALENGAARIQGVTAELGSTDIVLARGGFPASGTYTVRYPRIDVVLTTFLDFASLRFAVLAKDSASDLSFDRAVAGLPVPAEVSSHAGNGGRLVRHEILEVVQDCLPR